jgi:hypothetical protein
LEISNDPRASRVGGANSGLAVHQFVWLCARFAAIAKVASGRNFIRLRECWLMELR